MSYTLVPRVLPFVVICLLWSIPVAHYYVPTPTVSDQFIEQSRLVPEETVLDELNTFFSASSSFLSKSNLIAKAQNIVDGNSVPPGYPERKLQLPPDIGSFEKGSSRTRLYLARLAIPDTLIDAYEVSGNDAYLLFAKDLIASFARIEQKLWLDRGFIWNDHAVAERTMVAIKFWRAYRKHNSFNPADVKPILQLIMRSARLLSKPSHYNASTNHGVMQNLALLQICIAFPGIDIFESLVTTAYNRLITMMPCYLSAEGVILEHSAGYHQLGLEMVGKALRYFTLLHLTVPADLAEKYEKANRFYANIRRPDGSLPKFGDTSGWENKAGPLVTKRDNSGQYKKLSYKSWKPLDAASYHPESGYAVWWGGVNNDTSLKPISQTVIVWSYILGNAHKHADEQSFLLWANGQDWLTSVGSYPYGTALRKKAISWGGSNAPHLIGEPYDSDRHTRLLQFADTSAIKMIDLERTGPGVFKARRQLLFLESAGVWVVVDSTEGEPADLTRTIWNGENSTALEAGEMSNSFVFRKRDGKSYLSLYLIGNNDLKIEKVKGSQSPFAGWDGTKPAPALMVTQPAGNSMTAAAFLLNQSFDLPADGLKSVESDLSDPQNWSLHLPLPSGHLNIRRRSFELRVNDVTYTLTDAINTDLVKGIPSVQDGTALTMPVNLIAKIFAFVITKKFRRIASLFVFIALLIQEAAMWLYRRSHWKKIRVFRNVLSFVWVLVFLSSLSLNLMLIN